NIAFKSIKDQVIFERSEVVKNDGSPYTVFTPYAKAWKQKYTEQKVGCYNSEKLFDHFLKTESFCFPSLNKIGFASANIKVPQPVIDKEMIALYDKTRDIPYLNGTTRLSVHLRFGTISIRQLPRV